MVYQINVVYTYFVQKLVKNPLVVFAKLWYIKGANARVPPSLGRLRACRPLLVRSHSAQTGEYTCWGIGCCFWRLDQVLIRL